jgi:hypothetical protein
VKTKEEVDRELEALYAKAQDELSHVKDDKTFSGGKGRHRDVMVHIAVTIMPDVEGNHVMGEKEREIGQFAARIPARWFKRGLTQTQARQMFQELTFKAFERMKLYGLTRAGE